MNKRNVYSVKININYIIMCKYIFYDLRSKDKEKEKKQKKIIIVVIVLDIRKYCLNQNDLLQL